MADPKAALLSFPTPDIDTISAKEYERAISEYVKALDRFPATFWTKPLDKQSILEALNPTVNTIPYAIALRHHIGAATKDRSRQEQLLNVASVYFACLDTRQARYIGYELGPLLSWFFDGFRHATDLSPLSAAMLRVDPSAGTFTSFHVRLLRMCLEAGVPSQAIPVLDRNIYAFPQAPIKLIPEEPLDAEVEMSNSFITTKSGFGESIRSRHVLEFYVLGAFVYIGAHRYERARLFLEYVLLHPTQQHAVSVLQVEAYRKWVLVGLLAQGKPFPLPRTLDASVSKTIKAIAKPYDTLAEAYAQRNRKKFQAEVDVGGPLWTEDGNQEMVNEAASSLQRDLVLDLQKTYSALPMDKVAEHVDLEVPETLQLVTQMIRDSRLNASVINTDAAADGAVLRFHDIGPLSRTDSPAQDNDLQAQSRRIETLTSFVRDADRRLQLTKEYVDHVRRQRRAAQGPDGELAEQMDLTWDAPTGGPLMDDGDEDIMAT